MKAKAFTALAFILSGATGCVVHGARAAEMMARPESVRAVTVADRWFARVGVASVEGGAETKPYSGPNVANGEFRTALERSLQEVGYLAPDSSRRTIALAVRIVSLDAPQFGNTFSITSVVHYNALDRSTGATVFDGEVRAVATKSRSDAFLGLRRRQLANEASMRANIEAFLLKFRTAVDSIGK
jgi:hypothetical protein